MNLRSLGSRIGLVAAGLAVLAILAFYLQRLTFPTLPIFAADEGAYLLRALYPDDVMARDPYVAVANNSTHLSLIRIAFALGPMIVGDRLVNLLIYLVGLVLFWRFSARSLPREKAWGLLLLALGFAYYRFVITNMAEGPFVGLLALMALVTGAWARTRPWAHAAAVGVLGALLVLTKANGVAPLAALAVVMALDALVSHDLKRLPGRLALSAALFFAVGNLVQWRAGEPTATPWAFFISRNYSGQIGMPNAPGAVGLALQSLATMVSASAVLAGAPLVAGMADLWRRWRARTDGWTLNGHDLALLFLAGGLAGTLAMVGIYAMKVAGIPSETQRLWGRYFEFFAPLIWLAAAPALAKPLDRGVAWTAAGVMLAGLAGLVACLHSGIVLLPWDSTVLLAFFRPDPVRAPLGFREPYEAISIAICLTATAVLILGRRGVATGLTLLLALSLLSTWLDRAWLTPVTKERKDLAYDLKRIGPALPKIGDVVVLTPDGNDAPLVFLKLDARPRVWEGPVAEAPLQTLSGAQAAVVSGADPPPGGPWVGAYKGRRLSLWRRAAP